MLFTDHTQCVSYLQTSVVSTSMKKKELANGLTIKALRTFMKQWLNNMNLKEQMDLLSIKDVSTPRQAKNGTVVWQLPIKNKWKNGSFIEVASFSTGYVRNQNSGYSNYQLNKRCDSEPEYYQLANGDYRKYTTRTCKLIHNEADRLEYLIAYCLKNYYIKNANQVAEGSYVSKWEHEYKMNKNNKWVTKNDGDGDYAEKSLESHSLIIDLQGEVHDLQNKLATINRISSNE